MSSTPNSSGIPLPRVSPDDLRWKEFETCFLACVSPSNAPTWIKSSDLLGWRAYVDQQLLKSAFVTKQFQMLLPALQLEPLHPDTAGSRYTLLTALLGAVQQFDNTQQALSLELLFHQLHAGQGLLDQSQLPSASAYQVYLAMIGCLTLLMHTEEPGQDDWSAVSFPSGFKTVRQEQSLEPDAGTVSRALGSFLASYGDIIPPYVETDGDILHASVLNYAALHRWGQVSIRWVDHAGAHLTLNPFDKTLSLFAHPAYSALLCHGQPFRESVLKKLVEGYSGENEIDAVDTLLCMHQEILLSYRLLFGYDTKSQKLLMREKASSIASTSHFLKLLTAPRPSIWDRVMRGWQHSAPELPVTLWPKWARDEADRLAEQDEYNSVEFAIFGPRLLKLQQYSNRRKPRRVWDMWQDRRNRREWITFWAVLVVGGFSLLFALIQTILAGAQLSQ